jgi:hypothetical protein
VIALLLPTDPPVADATPQIALPLQPGPLADTPPPCRCCQGRGWLAGGRGWPACTWCEGSGVDPLKIAGWRRAWGHRRDVAGLERLAS